MPGCFDLVTFYDIEIENVFLHCRSQMNKCCHQVLLQSCNMANKHDQVRKTQLMMVLFYLTCNQGLLKDYIDHLFKVKQTLFRYVDNTIFLFVFNGIRSQ